MIVFKKKKKAAKVLDPNCRSVDRRNEFNLRYLKVQSECEGMIKYMGLYASKFPPGCQM